MRTGGPTVRGPGGAQRPGRLTVVSSIERPAVLKARANEQFAGAMSRGDA